MNPDTAPAAWTPTTLWEPLQIWTVTLAIVKIAISRAACDWGAVYSFCGIDGLGVYASIILLAFAISVPFGVFRSKRMQVAVFLCADIALAGYIFVNAGCVAAVIAGLLMLTTSAALNLIYRRRQKLLCVPLKGKLQYCSYLLLWGVLTYLL